MKFIIALCLLYPLHAMPLKVMSGEKTITRFDTEVARTEFQLSRGLQERRDLPQDKGMLFIFDIPQDVTMWMHKTPLSLDMLFADINGKVHHIAPNTTPYSTELIGPIPQTKYVLEINAGMADQHQIKVGHRLDLPE